MWCLVHVQPIRGCFCKCIHAGSCWYWYTCKGKAVAFADDYAGIYIKIFQYSLVRVLVRFIARVREFPILSKSRGFCKFWKFIRFFIVFSKWYRFPVEERAGLARPYMTAWVYNYVGIWAYNYISIQFGTILAWLDLARFLLMQIPCQLNQSRRGGDCNRFSLTGLDFHATHDNNYTLARIQCNHFFKNIFCLHLLQFMLGVRAGTSIAISNDHARKSKNR